MSSAFLFALELWSSWCFFQLSSPLSLLLHMFYMYATNAQHYEYYGVCLKIKNTQSRIYSQDFFFYFTFALHKKRPVTEESVFSFQSYSVFIRFSVAFFYFHSIFRFVFLSLSSFVSHWCVVDLFYVPYFLHLLFFHAYIRWCLRASQCVRLCAMFF